MTHSEEWHEARRKGIGGSDWQHIMWLEPYGCARKLWYEKIGATPDHPRRTTGAMTRGDRLEPVIADDYAELRGFKVRRKSTYAKNDLPDWWIGNIDRAIVGSDDGPGVAEIKTTNPWNFRKIKSDGPPSSWLWQIQHYLHLTGWKWAELVIVDPLNWDWHMLLFRPDHEDLDFMLEEGLKFWRMVENNDAPEALVPSDRRCQTCEFRGQCHGVALYDVVPDASPDALETVESLKMEGLLRDRMAVSKALDEGKEVLDRLNGEIKETLVAPRKVRCGNYRVYWTQSTQQRIDTKRFREEQPELAERYTKTVVSKPLRIIEE